MWSSTVGLVNGRHRYLTAETFGFKINSNGQILKRRQQWTIEPFPENLGPDGSISSATSVSSQCTGQPLKQAQQQHQQHQQHQHQQQQHPMQSGDPNEQHPCILTFNSNGCTSLTSTRSSNGSSASEQENCADEEHENVAIKSHLNKYLAVDSFGNVTCDSDEKTENARFTITICSMSQGRSKEEHFFWAFKNVERGYYLGTTEDGMICCNAKMPKSRAELWHLHLIPARGASFFSLKSLGRKRFARLVGHLDDRLARQQLEQANGNSMPTEAQVQLDATISWGAETLFQFRYFEGGRYSLLTSDCRYLTNEGKCLDWNPATESSLPPEECLFTLEYHSGFLAFRDSFSHYLAAAGRSSVLRSRAIGVSRDELFVFESAPIQVSLKATFNNRWVSIKQGVDLSANQTETSSKYETFQLTYHKQTQNWSIMTQDCNFWTVAANASGSTVSVCKPADYGSLNRGQFRLVWSETDATCSLKYVDLNKHERWIAARKSGQLFLAAPSAGGAAAPSSSLPPVKFVMRFQNRRLLNLRPVDGSGFVGLKAGPNSRQLEANKTFPDSIAIEYSELSTTGFESFGEIPNGVSKLGSQPQKIGPQVGPKPQVVQHQTEVGAGQTSTQTINMFNVRLNSTRMGQSVLDRFNNTNGNNRQQTGQVHSKSQAQQAADNIASPHQEPSAKEIGDLCLDGNNNDSTFILPATEDGPTTTNAPNGSVELAATPSVASIISSFSNARISNTTQTATNSDQNCKSPVQQRVGASVSKLASSFEGNGTATVAHGGDYNADNVSVVTSNSSATSSLQSASSDPTAAATTTATTSSNGNKSSYSADQVANHECCYMKMLLNNRYLVADDKDSGVLCDATNKACAQPWLLELRSHNSIAIRASDNHAYLQIGTNGTIFLSRCEPSEASLWEF